MEEHEKCIYHPDRDAVSFCRGCKKYFCSECLVEGPEYYYCKASACMKLYTQALGRPEEKKADERKAMVKTSITDEEKAWIEESFLWLIKQFGAETLKSLSVVLPTEDFFPDPYDGSDESVDALLARVCRYMKVDPDRLELIFFQGADPMLDLVPVYESSREGAAGLYAAPDDSDKLIIAVEISQLKDPELVIAAIAHELGHVHLLADKRLTGDESDHEPLTDLLTVFFGMGIFTANSAFNFSQWEAGLYQGWSMGRRGYLSEPMYGYALAGLAWMRDECELEWSDYLDSDVSHYFKRSLKYLDETENTTLPIIGHDEKSGGRAS